MPERRDSVRLSRAPTAAHLRILAVIVEAPGYPKLAHRLGVSRRTVRQQVAEIAAMLPYDFVRDGTPKERVVIYAMRLWSERQRADDRTLAESNESPHLAVSGVAQAGSASGS